MIQSVLEVVTILKEIKITERKMPQNFVTSSVNQSFAMQDHSYGKSGVKVLHLVRNGRK